MRLLKCFLAILTIFISIQANATHTRHFLPGQEHNMSNPDPIHLDANCRLSSKDSIIKLQIQLVKGTGTVSKNNIPTGGYVIKTYRNGEFLYIGLDKRAKFTIVKLPSTSGSPKNAEAVAECNYL